MGVRKTSRVASWWLAAIVITVGTCCSVAGAPAAMGATVTRLRAAATADAIGQIPDTAYPIPSNALFVAPTGNDTNPGTQDAPFQTVTHCHRGRTRGATIVLRAGVYRESFGTVTKKVTIQPYPHEQAWLSGSDVVTNWQPVRERLGRQRLDRTVLPHLLRRGRDRSELSVGGLARPGVLRRHAAHTGERHQSARTRHVLCRLHEPGALRRQRSDSAGTRRGDEPGAGRTVRRRRVRQHRARHRLHAVRTELEREHAHR